jgi:hypothetical protein
MGASVRPDPVADYLAARTQSAHDPVADYLSAKGVHDYHAEYKSGALQKRMAGANARDQANAADETNAQPGYVERGATHVLNAAQGIPGVHAVEAGAGSLGSQMTDHPMNYRQSYNALNDATGQIGGKTAAAERIMGSVAALPFLPASAPLAGAALGASEGALDANPDMGIGGRAYAAGWKGAVGAGVGKVAEMAPVGFAALRSKSGAAMLAARDAARSAAATPLYNKAMQEGAGRTVTPAVAQALKSPDLAEIVSELQQTRALAGKAPESPEMMDAVYKVLSDRAALLKRGQDAVTPTRPNIGRFRLQDTHAAQGDLMDAMAGGTTMPGPMPSYRPAVQTFAQHSGEMNALQRGNDALLDQLSHRMPRGKMLDRTTPEAQQDWAAGATEGQRAAAGEGMLGAVRAAFSPSTPMRGIKALWNAPTTARTLGVPLQETLDTSLRRLLLGANAARQQ